MPTIILWKVKSIIPISTKHNKYNYKVLLQKEIYKSSFISIEQRMDSTTKIMCVLGYPCDIKGDYLSSVLCL